MPNIFQPQMMHGAHQPRETVHRLARFTLVGFLLTFMLARAMVFLIMARRIPNLYLFMHGTHVHHLNYGIVLLSVVAGYGIFRRPNGRAVEIAALAYGVTTFVGCGSVSIGVGTTRPFEFIASDWLNADALAAALNAVIKAAVTTS